MIVEGHGDVASFPDLAGKIAGWLGIACYVVNPIRCGGWTRLKRPNGLETLVRLAATRPGCERIVIAVDLDDGCPVQEFANILQRKVQIEQQVQKSIEICFVVREFEAWFLASLDSLAAGIPEYGWIETEPVDGHHTLRDAKGRLRSCMTSEYGEATDQGVLVRGIDPPTLYERDRSFRRLVRALSGLDYQTLQSAI